MNAGERSLHAVPGRIWAALLCTLALHLGVQTSWPPPATAATDLPPAPSAQTLRAASLGEPAALARLAMLYLQAFDLGAGNTLPYRQLDYVRLEQWLRAILDADPRSQYPLFTAARIYAEVDDAAKSRRMLEFVHRAYLQDPNRRWPALAHATLLAKHRLRDLPLARRYAADLQRFTTDPAAPFWAKQMEIFILEDMDELEAAKIVLGGLLAAGRISDLQERRFLQERLEALERRLPSKP